MYGVSRVTDTTRLDRIGMPVYAAIRPDAEKGSLCVSSGKGLSKEAAKVGALMEAYELCAAQYDPNRDTIKVLYNFDIENQSLPVRITDLCPRLELHAAIRKASFSAKIHCIECNDVNGPGSVYLPAELVFHPYANAEIQFFPTSSNGLAGGNDKAEALAHATLEVMERHVLSYVNIGSSQKRLTNIACPDLNDTLAAIEKSGLNIEICFCQNEFNMPMFIAYLIDSDYLNSVSIARGQGFHWNREVALIRAVTEAVQSRLTNIHGGRDDIVERLKVFQTKSAEVKAVNSLVKRIKALESIEYQLVCEGVEEGIGVGSNLASSRLKERGYESQYYYELNPEQSDFSIVKVIIPRLEYFTPLHKRVGPGILEYMREQ